MQRHRWYTMTLGLLVILALVSVSNIRPSQAEDWRTHCSTNVEVPQTVAVNALGQASTGQAVRRTYDEGYPAQEEGIVDNSTKWFCGGSKQPASIEFHVGSAGEALSTGAGTIQNISNMSAGISPVGPISLSLCEAFERLPFQSTRDRDATAEAACSMSHLEGDMPIALVDLDAERHDRSATCYDTEVGGVTDTFRQEERCGAMQLTGSWTGIGVPRSREIAYVASKPALAWPGSWTSLGVVPLQTC